jgi:hypothetical protein
MWECDQQGCADCAGQVGRLRVEERRARVAALDGHWDLKDGRGH